MYSYAGRSSASLAHSAGSRPFAKLRESRLQIAWEVGNHLQGVVADGVEDLQASGMESRSGKQWTLLFFA